MIVVKSLPTSLVALVILFLLFAFTTRHTLPPVFDDPSPISLDSKQLLSHKDINALLSPAIFQQLQEQVSYAYTAYGQALSNSPPTDLPANNLVAGTTADLIPLTCEKVFQDISTTTSQLNWHIQAKHVRFPDSDQVWTICAGHEKRDTDSWDNLASYLSRIPIPLRQHVHTILSLPLDSSPLLRSDKNLPLSPHAMMSQSTVTFFGIPNIGTWVHEFAHALDINSGFSRSRLWRNAIREDECVADMYARSSVEEASFE